jgi:hypothetical protein
MSELYKSWEGRYSTICNVDTVIDALAHIHERRARAYAKECLVTAPEWAKKLIDELARKLGLEKELDEVIKEIFDEKMKLRNK